MWIFVMGIIFIELFVNCLTNDYIVGFSRPVKSHKKTDAIFASAMVTHSGIEPLFSP